MSVVSSGEAEGERKMLLNDAIVESLRYMGAFTQRTLKFADTTVSSEQHVAKKLPPVDNMLISRQTFKQDIMSEYNRIPFGQMRQVVAATGVGKSTMMPCEIVNATGKNGLILTPLPDLSYANGEYLIHRFAKEHYPGVTPVQLRSDHAKQPLPGKVLYYDVAASFFAMLAVNRRILDVLGIEMILFDESHVRTAPYVLAELLASARVFVRNKIMLVSATRGEVSMEHETSDSLRRLVSVEPHLLELGNVFSLPSNSPLHHSRITTQTLVFVPDLKDIPGASQYYEQYDIPVMVHTSTSSSKGLPLLDKFLEENAVCVVLTDGVLETGFTKDFGVVVECGYMQDMRIDLVNKKVSLVKQPVTMSIRKQRCGRVGRHRKGIAYFANIDSSPEPVGLSDTTACYLALWCRVFNLSTNLPDVVRFREYFGEMTHRKAMMLLHCHVHPILASPYMDQMGRMCHGWEKVFNMAMRQMTFLTSDEDKSQEMQDWVFQNIYDERFLQQLERISVPLTVPEPWAPFFYAVWKTTNTDGRRWVFDDMDNRSVLSVVPEERRTRGHWRSARSRESAASLAYSVVGPAMKSAVSVSGTTIQEEDDKLPTPDRLAFPQATIFQSASRRGSTLEVPYKRERPLSLPSVLPTVYPKEAPISKVESPVLGPALQDYKQVKASTLHVEKVYPYRSDLLKEFLAKETRRTQDVDRVDELRAFKVKLHGMSDETRGKYVLSLLRCWNFNVVSVTQLLANDTKPSFFSLKPTAKQMIAQLERAFDAHRPLMAAMEIEGVKFAVARTGRHGSGDPVRVADSTLVNDRLSYLADRLELLVLDGTPLGVFLRDGACILSLLHVFEPDGALYRPADAYSLRIMRGDDLIVINEEHQSVVGILGLVREPITGEQAYILSVSQGNKVRVLGKTFLHLVAGKWFHTVECDSGSSGAPLVSVRDGKLLGMHMGASVLVDHFKSMVVPVYKVLPNG